MQLCLCATLWVCFEMEDQEDKPWLLPCRNTGRTLIEENISAGGQAGFQCLDNFFFFVISCIKYTNTGKYRWHNISSWVCVSNGNTCFSSTKAVLKWARGLSSENIQRYKCYWEWGTSKFLWVSMCFLLERLKHWITSWTSWTFPQSSWIYWSIIMKNKMLKSFHSGARNFQDGDVL